MNPVMNEFAVYFSFKTGKIRREMLLSRKLVLNSHQTRKSRRSFCTRVTRSRLIKGRTEGEANASAELMGGVYRSHLHFSDFFFMNCNKINSYVFILHTSFPTAPSSIFWIHPCNCLRLMFFVVFRSLLAVSAGESRVEKAMIGRDFKTVYRP